MRFFELLLLLSLLLILVNIFLLNKNRRLMIISSLISVLSLLCHLVIEGGRIQMFPAYLITFILLLISLRHLYFPVKERTRPSSLARRILRYSGIFLTFLLLILVAIPPTLFPVFKLPETAGSMGVGTATLFFRDSSRVDLFSDKVNSFREISVRVWYPASSDAPGRAVPYMQADEARYMSEHLNLPPFILSHYKRVKTQSHPLAIPMEGSFPLVLYSPSGDMVQNTGLFQDLASKGYVVISVGHPYWNAFSYDSKGQVVPFDNQNTYYQAMWDEERSEEANASKEEVTTAPDLLTKQEAHSKLNKHMPLEVADIRLWSEDLSYLLDQLGKPDQNHSWISRHIDLQSIGVIGFSKGGTTAAQFIVSDPRCRAGVNLSGFMFGDAVDSACMRPFMILENFEEWCPDCKPICEVFFENALCDAYMVRIKGARHGNFSDWSLVGGFLRIIGMTGSIRGHRCLEIQNHYVGSFFDLYLKGMDTPLLKGADGIYPEVEFDSRNIRISG
jgi:predicted dienelactone hydrolase